MIKRFVLVLNFQLGLKDEDVSFPLSNQKR